MNKKNALPFATGEKKENLSHAFSHSSSRKINNLNIYIGPLVFLPTINSKNGWFFCLKWQKSRVALLALIKILVSWVWSYKFEYWRCQMWNMNTLTIFLTFSQPTRYSHVKTYCPPPQLIMLDLDWWVRFS